jgi:hypothetical protein
MKPSGTVWQPIVLLAMLTLYLLAISGCESAPTDPSLSGTGEMNYAVYFYSTYGDEGLYKYYPLTQELDSADLHYQVTGYDHFNSLHVSADGELLYMPFEQIIVVFDSDSLYPVAELPYKTRYPVAVSPDGKYIAIFGNGVWVLNTSDYSVYYHDTTNAVRGVFSSNGMRLYAMGSETEPPYTAYLYVLDLSGPEPVLEKRKSPGSSSRFLPTSDESKFVLVDASGWIRIFDVASDSIVFSHYMRGAKGRVALTPDDKYAFYGSMTPIAPPDPGTSAFAMIDVQNNQLEEIVSTRFVIDSITPDWFEVGSVQVTPDGKYLVMLDGPFAYRLLLYSLESRTFVDYINFGNVALTNMDIRILTE